MMNESSTQAVESPKTIVCKEREGMFQVIFNRPPLNVFSLEMVEELNEVLAELLYRTDLKVLVFSASGTNFCAGVPVDDFVNDRAYQLTEAFTRLFQQLQSLNAPIVSMIQGLTIASGFEIVLLSDIVIAGQSARLGLPQIKMGFFSPVALALLMHSIPRKRASEMILTGELISAAEAEKYGLVNALVPDDKLQEYAGNVVSRLLNCSAPVLQITKKAIVEAQSKTLTDAVSAAEELCLTELLSLEDHTEGVRALAEKRKPVWKNQ